ncbi:MAG: ECF transporter S component [Coprobacillaceae bacterium]
MKNNKTRKLVMASILAALGMVLNLIEIPYPFAPWMNLDLSEAVVLIAVSMLGVKYALFVSIAKFAISILIKGPVGPIAIGQITGLIASMSIALTYFGLTKVIVTKYKILDYILQMLGTMFVLAMVMFLANYFFVTPTYLAQKPTWYTDLPFTVDINAFNSQYGSNIGIPSFLKFLSPYGQAIFIIYFPFNFLKGILTGAVYYFIKPLEKRFEIE